MKKLLAMISSMLLFSTVTACGNGGNDRGLPENEKEGGNTTITDFL